MNIDSQGLYFVSRIDTEQLKHDIEDIKGQLHSIGDKAKQEGQSIDEAFAKIGKTVASVFTIQQVGEFIKNIVGVRQEIESLEISFETLLGDKGKADALFGELRTFAVQTPLMLKDLAQGAQMLLSFNIAAEDVMPTLRAIGDISMGDSQKFQALTLAFSQMSSTGKLMGQDLLQMINAGFNPLTVIAEKTGKSMAQLKDDMAAGSISSKMVADAFKQATSEGGKFYKMLEKQSKGLKGSISNLQGAYEDMMNDLGEAIQEPVSNAISKVTELLNNYQDVGLVLGELIAVYGTYKAAVIAVGVATEYATMVTKGWTAAEMLSYKWMVLQDAAQKMLNKTMLSNPYVAAATALAALTAGVVYLVTRQSDAEAAQERLNKAFKDCEASIYSEQVQIDYLFGRLRAAKKGSNEYKAAKQAIINQYGQYLKGLSSEIQSLSDVEAAYRAVAAAARDAARARAMKTYVKEEADNYAETMGDVREKVRDLLIKKFGSKQGQTYFWKIVPVLEGKQRITKEIQGIINKLNTTTTVLSPTTGTYAYSATTNVLKTYIREAQNAKTTLDTAIKNAEARFGAAPEGESGGGGGKPAKVIKNKKYYEDLVKDQTAQYEALTIAEKNSKKGRELARKISENQRYVDSYTISKSSPAAGRAAKAAAAANSRAHIGATDAENQQKIIAQETAERNRQIQQYADNVAKQRRQSELDIRQETINLMDESVDKEIKQNKLNYDRLIFENKKRLADYVESFRDKKEAEWENSNPMAKKDGKSFDRSTVTVKDWQEAEPQLAAQIDEYDRIAYEAWERANKKTLDKMIEDVATYEQQRAKIISDYAKKRSNLYETYDQGKSKLREGATTGNIDDINQKETEALEALDEQFASKSDYYQAWCDSIGNMSLEQLEIVLKRAKKALDDAKKDGATPEQLAVARASVVKAQKALNKERAKQKANDDINPSARSLKEWKDLYDVLGNCTKEFEKMGNEIGGTAGKIISAAGQIATSTLGMVNDIKQIVDMSTNGMQAAAAKGAKSIKALERASVILTIISAAIQLATTVANLFNDDDTKQKQIEHLQQRIDQLQWELDNQDVVRLQQSNGTALKLVNDELEKTRASLSKEYVALQSISNIFDTTLGKATLYEKLMRESAENIATAYANMSYTADKALGADKFASAREQLENITTQQILIQKQIDNERSKKKTDYDKIDDWEQKIEELGEKALKVINDMVEDIIGGTSSEIATQLSDAFYEAFSNGEDAAKAWGDKVDEIVADVLKRMMVQKYLEEPLGDIFNKYKSRWFKDGNFMGIDAVIDSMTEFRNDLNSTYSAYSTIISQLPEDLQKLFSDTASSREGAEKGIAQASQDSVDELNGRMTAVQGHTYSINENTKLLVSTTNAILESVINIDRNTDGLSAKVDALGSQIRAMRSDVNDIAIKGVNIKR